MLRSGRYEGKENLPHRKQHMVLSHNEKNQIAGRIRTSLLKYLVRDPVFLKFTEPFIRKVMEKCYVPSVLTGYLLAYVNYFRYYSFIA